jgi:DNA repair exonuclease SbcCD ATPase subunit
LIIAHVLQRQPSIHASLSIHNQTARVTIRGSVNAKDFVIARSKSASRGSLTFIFDGEDLTKQSIKDTQEAIEEILGTDSQILSRTIFHGQHTINGLLEASDAKLKDELSIIVPLDTWQDSAARARKKGRDLSKTVSELDGMIFIRQRDLETLKAKYDGANRMVTTKRQSFLDFEDQVKKRFEAEESKSDQENVSIDRIQSQVEECAGNIQAIEEMVRRNYANAQNDLEPLQEELESKLINLNNERLSLQEIQRQCDRNELSLANAKENLQSLQHQWGLSEVKDKLPVFSIPSPSVCPTCKQTMDDHVSQQHFKDEVERSLSDAMSTIDTLHTSLTNDLVTLRNKTELVVTLEREIETIQSDIKSRQSRWNEIERNLQINLDNARKDYSQKSKELSEAVRNLGAMHEWSRIKSNLSSELKSHQDSLTNAMNNLNAISKDYEEMMENVKNLKSDREVARSEADIMSMVAEHFGPRGVQTFILQNTVHALQLSSQYYLDELSDGSLRLELMLDSCDRILRSASVLKSDGSWISRPLSSLSGGQWRRCSLALSLGFADLVARRGRLSSSLLVLDEPLTHLDSAGRDNVGRLLRKVIQRKASDDDLDGRPKRFGGLSVSTILIILQDLVAEELSESFDCIDEVVKFKGYSKLVLDEERFNSP